MLDDFFIRAVVAGVGLALIAGPLGCLIVWRRMAYFSDTLAHAGLLGIAFSFLLQTNLILGIFAVAAIVSLALLFLERQRGFSADAVLGMLSHSALALGLVVLALMAWVRVDLRSFLFGDILSVSRLDIAIIYGGAAVIAAVLLRLWRPLLAATVDTDLAEAEGQRPAFSRLIFMLLIAGVVAIAIKLVGVLLIGAMLIIPPLAARQISVTPEQMAVYAVFFGMASVVSGLFGSLRFDTPSGPSIVVSALMLFLASFAFAQLKTRAVKT